MRKIKSVIAQSNRYGNSKIPHFFSNSIFVENLRSWCFYILCPVILLLCAEIASAADFCTSNAGLYDGVQVTLSGNCGIGASNRRILRDSESCNFQFSKPVTDAKVYVEVTYHWQYHREKIAFDVNGSHHSFSKADIEPSLPARPPNYGLGVDSEGDLVAEKWGEGSGRAAINEISVSSITAKRIPLIPSPGEGAAFYFCFSTNPPRPKPKLNLSKFANSPSFTVGVPSSYTLALGNLNFGAATTATTQIVDDVPPSLEIGAALPNECSRTGQRIVCDVPAGLVLATAFVIPVTPLAAAIPAVSNTAWALGGGDAACNATGLCASTVQTPVLAGPTIRSVKTASANPLLVGASGQFYDIAVTVAGTATTQPIALNDQFPTGILPLIPVQLIAGTTTGTVVGCGGPGPGCSVAAGVQPGNFSIRIPVTVAAEAVGPAGGTNTINLSGGGDPACTNAIDACDATTPVTAVVDNRPSVRTVKNVTSGSGSNAFTFAMTGLSAPSETIVVVGVNSNSGSPAIKGQVGAEATITESSPAGWPANPVSASCVDMASTNTAATFGALDGRTLTIPAANMRSNADIRCTFVNSFAISLTGRIFEDNGVKAGIANDGVANGAEAGLANVNVRLTNCAGVVQANTVSDAAGFYSLTVPASVAKGASLCIEKTASASYVSTGASVGSTRIPSGSTASSAGVTYAYTRASGSVSGNGTAQPDRMAFDWNEATLSDLNFGAVRLNTFSAGGLKGGLAGSTLVYTHSFVARTSGSLKFGIASVLAEPEIGGWSEKIFADPGCSGTLQPGAALLYPASVPLTVTAGQLVCIVMQESIPAGARLGSTQTVTVGADFVFTNAAPSLSATYSVRNVTTVSANALELKKEVRNVTQSGVFGIDNRAKSGETLEYRITYVNNGPEPITGLTLNDMTPVYTSFLGSREDSTPSSLTACVKNTPANPAPATPVACGAVQPSGGAGALDWKFVGPLNPGGNGSVLFNVKVN